MEVSKEYIAVFEPDEEGWTASVPDLPGCFSDGETLADVEVSIRLAIQLWIDTAQSKGWPVPPPRTEVQRIAV